MKKTTYLLMWVVISLLGVTHVFAQLPACGPNVTLSFQQTNVNCFGGATGSASVSVNGGTGNYLYTWTPTNASTASISNLAAGTYNIYVANLASGGGNQLVYSETFDNAVQAWTLNTATGANDPDANFFTIGDGEGGVTPPACGVAGNGDNTLHITNTLTPTNGATYNAGGLCVIGICVNSNKRAESPNISTVGFTSLVLTFDFIGNGQGLLDNASLVYSTNGGTSWTTLNNSLKSPVCASGQGQWTAASYTLPPACENISNLRIGFVWTNNDDGVGTDPSFAVNAIKINGSTGGGGSGSCYVTGAVTITQPTAALTATATGSQLGCGVTQGTASVVASGGTAPYTYLWSNNQTTASISNLPIGTYNCTITDSKGCTTTASASVTGIPSQTVSVTATALNCAGDKTATATANVSGGAMPYTYSWASGQNTPSITNLGTGVYTCYVTDANGCVVSSSVTITQPSALSANSSSTPTSGSLNSGTATVSVSGGTPGYTFSWNTTPAQVTQTAVGLAAGTYICTIKDSKGCQIQISVTVSTSGTISPEALGVMDCKIYPNPAENYFVMDVKLAQNEDIFVTMFDAQGKEVRSYAFANTATMEQNIEVKTLPKGMYFVKLTLSKGSITKVVTVQ